MSSVCVSVKTVGKNTEPIKNSHIRKCSCLINPIVSRQKGVNPYQVLCVKYFDAQIRILHHHTTIQAGYEGVLHIEGVRQTVQVLKLQDDNSAEKKIMRTGDTGVIRFKFKYGVEFIEPNARIMVREGNTKAFGYIKKVYPMNQPPTDVIDQFTHSEVKAGTFATEGMEKLKI